MRRILAVLVAASVLGACDDSTGIGAGAQVSVDFRARPSGTALSVMALDGPVAASIDVPGTNGVLSLDAGHIILAEFELERTEGTLGCVDDSTAGEDDSSECEEIERGPMFLELPLESGEVTSVSGTVEPGSYDEFEFEFEDLEDDEDDPAANQRIGELLTEIRTQFPDWPVEASVRLEGSFTPEGGEPVPFVVYVAAEIEIEMEFETPFVVTEEDVSRTVTVELDPRDLVLVGDGTVIDLSAYDYGTTGQVLEFEVEIDDAFHGIDHDD